MTTDASHESPAQREILAGYQGGQRLIVLDWIDGWARVSDVPAGAGASYVIDPDARGVENRAELVEDYLDVAERLGCCPMAAGGYWTTEPA
jgi:hypothetical protein